jgi:hypothetical protein
MKYKNWPEDKKVSKKYQEVIDGWVMPEEVAAFFPGEELLFGGAIFYLHDGMWWDLMKHEYTEN